MKLFELRMIDWMGASSPRELSEHTFELFERSVSRVAQLLVSDLWSGGEIMWAPFWCASREIRRPRSESDAPALALSV